MDAGSPSPLVAEVASPDDRERERVFLGLRRAAGVVAGAAGRALWDSPAGSRLAAAGVLDMRGDRLVIVDPFRTDAVTREVLAVKL